MAKSTSSSAKSSSTTPASTGLAAVAAMATQAATVAVAAQPVKKPAVAYTNGVNPLAPANAPAVTIGGNVYTGTIAASNAAHRGAVGKVSNKVPGQLAVGKPYTARAAQNVAYWQAVQMALANGTNTASQLANAAGCGGAAFIGYLCKNGNLIAA